MTKRVVRSVLLTGSLSFLLAMPASACPNCKEAVSAQPEEVAKMAQGFNWSIVLMLGTPLTLLGTGAFFVRRAVKLGIMPEL
ncbi:MAG: hypothetical protein U0790_19505 [Isosphaeraceae bacterium]